MLKPSREEYLELGICVIGAVAEFHKETGETIFNLPKIIKAIHKNTMKPEEMKALMDELRDMYFIHKLTEKFSCDCDDCCCEECEEDLEEQEDIKEEDELIEELERINELEELLGMLKELVRK